MEHGPGSWPWSNLFPCEIPWSTPSVTNLHLRRSRDLWLPRLVWLPAARSSQGQRETSHPWLQKSGELVPLVGGVWLPEEDRAAGSPLASMVDATSSKIATMAGGGSSASQPWRPKYSRRANWSAMAGAASSKNKPMAADAARGHDHGGRNPANYSGHGGLNFKNHELDSAAMVGIGPMQACKID